jgi:WD40 repeat protein/energy-coupling factor transporter ATP-binding protein EcfA2
MQPADIFNKSFKGNNIGAIMKSPFKFLDSYSLADREIFFGCDQEITDLYRKVFESKILLVYGVSGTGKSSLINCGLASRFDESDWLPVNVRRGSNIVESLDDAINKQAISPLKKNLTISEKIQSLYLDHFKPVFLVFDQFEELFIFGSQEERTDFIRLIKEVVRSKTQCRIILVIREEFLAGITEFEEMLPEIFANRFRVEKMKRVNAILTVKGPCNVHKIKTEDGFADELVDKLIPTGQEIELTFLQIYLDRIFRIAAAEKKENEPIKFSKELLTRAGSVSDLLGQFLEEQIREMEDPETGMTILKSFVSIQGTKRQMAEKEILDSIGAFGTEITEQNLLRYLTKFVDLRILRERDEAGRFELRHDALAAKIYEKFTLQDREVVEVKQFVENAYQTFNTRKTYLSADDLEYLAPYGKRLFLPPALDQFVKQSRDKLQSQQRALKRLTRIFLVLVGLGIRYYLKQKSKTDVQELTILALLQEKADPKTSLSSALKIREKDTASYIVPGIIFNSFYSLLQEKLSTGSTSIPKELQPVSIPLSDSIVRLKMNKAGTHLFGWTAAKEVFLWHIGDSSVHTFNTSFPVLAVEMNENARFFAVIYLNNNGEVFTADGTRMFHFRTTSNDLMNERLVRFFPSGKYFLAVVNGNMAQVYDSAGICLFNLEGHTGSVNSLDISPDGRFIVTASSDKKALIWNFNHKTGLFSPYNKISSHKDTVWSCEFNRKGKYILTSSADSTLIISDLYGRLWSNNFTYATNNFRGIYSWFTGESNRKRPDWYNLYTAPYYFKICNACFAANDSAIIATNYGYNILNSGDKRGLFQGQVIYFGNSANISRIIDPFFSKAKDYLEALPAPYFIHWTISPDRHYFATVPKEYDKIILTSPNGYQLIDFKGKFPNFSSNSRYIYYLDGNTIRTMILDLDLIHYQFNEMKIFGDTENGSQPWILL